MNMCITHFHKRDFNKLSLKSAVKCNKTLKPTIRKRIMKML